MTKQGHFAVFQPHTLTKHQILGAYLKAWATILAPRFRQVWFVDAFAGEGQDREGNPGSPLIAARTAAEINSKHFSDGIGRNQGMRIIAFESHSKRYQALTSVMDPFIREPWHQGIAVVREGTLEGHLDGVLRVIGTAPTLFFLDPFGIDGLSAAVLPRLLQAPHNELLILFNDEGAVRLAGKARTGAQDEAAAIYRAEEGVSTSLFGEADTESQRVAARDRVKRSLSGHKSNADAERIMDVAFGGNWWRPIVDSTPEAERQAKVVELYEQLLERIGGIKRLRFSIDTDGGRHKYFLLHVSKDRRAYAAMKDAMHRARTSGEASGRSTLPLLEHFVSSTNISEIADAICGHFAGQLVRWTGVSPSVKAYALDETPLWFHECDALKEELRRRGCAILGENGKAQRPQAFRFPEGGTS